MKTFWDFLLKKWSRRIHSAQTHHSLHTSLALKTIELWCLFVLGQVLESEWLMRQPPFDCPPLPLAVFSPPFFFSNKTSQSRRQTDGHLMRGWPRGKVLFDIQLHPTLAANWQAWRARWCPPWRVWEGAKVKAEEESVNHDGVIGVRGQ